MNTTTIDMKAPFFDEVQAGHLAAIMVKGAEGHQRGNSVTLRRLEFDSGLYVSKWVPSRNHAGRSGQHITITRRITHVMSGVEGIAEGWVALSLAPVEGE